MGSLHQTVCPLPLIQLDIPKGGRGLLETFRVIKIVVFTGSTVAETLYVIIPQLETPIPISWSTELQHASSGFLPVFSPLNGSWESYLLAVWQTVSFLVVCTSFHYLVLTNSNWITTLDAVSFFVYQLQSDGKYEYIAEVNEYGGTFFSDGVRGLVISLFQKEHTQAYQTAEIWLQAVTYLHRI